MNLKTQLETPPQNLLEQAAVFLDFDGTLVEIAARPEDVIIPPRLYALLSSLHQNMQQRIALVSGRSVGVLRQDFGIEDIAIAGSHGNEISIVGRKAPDPEPPHAVAKVIAELMEFASEHDGIVVEPKAMGVGLHFRLAPGMEDDCRKLAYECARKHGLNVQAGKMLFEIYSGNEDKGSAIRKLCALAPFKSGTPVFIGDDKTDEHGFAAVRDLGGAGILVGAARQTHARYRLDDVAAVHDWLWAASKSIKDDM